MRHFGTIVAFGVVLLLVLSLWAANCGSVEISVDEWIKILSGQPAGIAETVFFQLRLPRIVMSIACGAALSAAGGILQGVMGNPLASPDILGISAGAGVSALILLLFFPLYINFLVPAAFIGAFAAAMAVYLLAWKRGIDPLRLILSGVAVSMLLSSLSTVLLLFNSEKIGTVLNFTLGNFGAVSANSCFQVLPYIIAGLVLSCYRAEYLNVLTLGDDIASELGVSLERERGILLILSALLSGCAVSVAGLLGFAGLIAPHLTRKLLGEDYRIVIPGAMFLGGAIVLIADTVARTVVAPAELPTGVVLALIGPVFFLYLLRSKEGYGH